MKLTCYVIDDEPLAVSLLESYVKIIPSGLQGNVQQCCSCAYSHI